MQTHQSFIVYSLLLAPRMSTNTLLLRSIMEQQLSKVVIAMGSNSMKIITMPL